LLKIRYMSKCFLFLFAVKVLSFGPNYGIQYRYAYPNKDIGSGPAAGVSALEDAGKSAIHILDTVHLKSTASSFIDKDRTESSLKGDSFSVAPTDNAVIVEDDFQKPPGATARTGHSEHSHPKVDNSNHPKARNASHSRTGRRRLPGYTQSFGFMNRMKGVSYGRNL